MRPETLLPEGLTSIFTITKGLGKFSLYNTPAPGII
jgi:hypothetical protein